MQGTRHLAWAIAAAAGPARAAVAQDFPVPSGHHSSFPFRAGGADRHPRPDAGPRLEQKRGKPLVVEKQARRRRPDRRELRREGAARRPHPADRAERDDGDQRQHLQEPALRSGHRLDAARAGRRRPFVLIVNPALPVQSVADLIMLARSTPGSLAYASAGPAAPHHCSRTAQEHDRHRDDPRALQGAAPALNDVVAGHVPLMFVDLGPALPLIQAGKVRALGVSTASAAAPRPKFRRSAKPAAGLRRGVLADGGGAGENPAADGRQAACRAPRHSRRAGDQGVSRQARHGADGAGCPTGCSASSSRRSTAGARSSSRPASPVRNRATIPVGSRMLAKGARCPYKAAHGV